MPAPQIGPGQSPHQHSHRTSCENAGGFSRFTGKFYLDNDGEWTTNEHTDVPVPVTAEGPGAERFVGQHPNTYVHEVLSQALAPTE